MATLITHPLPSAPNNMRRSWVVEALTKFQAAGVGLLSTVLV
jgi:hypothetical protein